MKDDEKEDDDLDIATNNANKSNDKKAITINSLESLKLDTRYEKENLTPIDYKPIALVVTKLLLKYGSVDLRSSGGSGRYLKKLNLRMYSSCKRSTIKIKIFAIIKSWYGL